MEDKETPQVAEVEATATDAVETPQPEANAESSTPAVTQKESTPAEPAKAVITPEMRAQIDREVSEKTAETRRQEALWRKQAYDLALQQQAAEMQRQEEAEKAQDRAAVESGAITEQEAAAKAQYRQDSLRQKQDLAQTRQLNEQLTQQASALGRVRCAHDMAEVAIDALKKSGLSDITERDTLVMSETLAKDKTLQTPDSMRAKAFELANQKLADKLRVATAKPESFDKGPSGDSVEVDSKMSARDLARKAYSQK